MQRSKACVVLDTNVYVSALLGTSQSCSALIRLILGGEIISYSSPEIKQEVKEVLARRKFQLDEQLQRDFLRLAFSKALMVNPKRRLHVCQDVDDNKLFECAAQTGAIIISGDKGVRAVEDWITWTPREALARLAERES